MAHENIKVSIDGPSENYTAHMLTISSGGSFSLSAHSNHTTLHMHRIELDELRQISDTISTYLADHPAEEKEKAECRLCDHLKDVVPGQVGTYGMKCEFNMRPETCGKFEKD